MVPDQSRSDGRFIPKVGHKTDPYPKWVRIADSYPKWVRTVDSYPKWVRIPDSYPKWVRIPDSYPKLVRTQICSKVGQNTKFIPNLCFRHSEQIRHLRISTAEGGGGNQQPPA